MIFVYIPWSSLIPCLSRKSNRIRLPGFWEARCIFLAINIKKTQTYSIENICCVAKVMPVFGITCKGSWKVFLCMKYTLFNMWVPLKFHTKCLTQTLKYMASYKSKINESLYFRALRRSWNIIWPLSEWPCDVLLTSAPGELASPNWPDNYPASTRCSWRISAPDNMRVHMRYG